MNTERFNLEMRVLIDHPAEGMMRGQVLEMDLSLITDVQCPNRLCSILHDAAILLIQRGHRQFRIADQIPAGLLMAFESAFNDEDVADCHGLVYSGAFARWIGVDVEISANECTVNKSV